MSDKRIKEFIRFMKDNGAFKTFVLSYDPAFYYEYSDLEAETITKFLKEVEDDEVINEAFLWASTIAGRDFWCELNDKWYSYVKTNLGGFEY